MGCTTSAPNMANPSTAEKSIQFEDEDCESNSKIVDEIIYRAADDIKVLPSCDTLPEPVHLVRNKSTASLNNDKENPENGYVTESNSKAEPSCVLQNKEKVSRLKEVVEKVVQLHATKLVDERETVEKITEELPKTEEHIDKHKLEECNAVEKNEKEPIPAQDQNQDDSPEEASSPCQSESSRATRWEALADIAAELPPSLTVDPITGQIYAVSK